jgi:hypothetical protein
MTMYAQTRGIAALPSADRWANLEDEQLRMMGQLEPDAECGHHSDHNSHAVNHKSATSLVDSPGLPQSSSQHNLSPLKLRSYSLSNLLYVVQTGMLNDLFLHFASFGFILFQFASFCFILVLCCFMLFLSSCDQNPLEHAI